MKSILSWLNEPTACRRWQLLALVIIVIAFAAIELAIMFHQQSQIEILHESAWDWHRTTITGK